MIIRIAVLVFLACSAMANVQTPLNLRDADTVFQDRVAAYVEQRNELASLAALPLEPTDARSAAAQRARLGPALRALRSNHRHGVVFAGIVGRGFRRAASIVMDRPEVEHWVVDRAIHAYGIAHARVNEPLPVGAGHDVHPAIVAALPDLPGGLLYRVLHYDLIIWDPKADFIVDVLPGVFFVETT